jgi:hypothetical protein
MSPTMGDINDKPPIALIRLTPEQQSIFDAEIEKLRGKLDLRKAIMKLPTVNEREIPLDSLRRVVTDLKTISQSKALGVIWRFSLETEEWLKGAEAVANELRIMAETPRGARGMRRPNEYRKWLIGEQIPALYTKVFGKPFPLTLGSDAMQFARYALKVLGEKKVKDETIKTNVSNVRREVRARKTPTRL